MDNPCKHCDKSNIDYVNDCEYGCDSPCEKAKEFWNSIGKRLDEILSKLKEIEVE